MLFLIALLPIVFAGCSVPLISGKPDMKEVEDKIETDLTLRLTGSAMPTDPSTHATADVDCPEEVTYRRD